jgi:hypothetical protein
MDQSLEGQAYDFIPTGVSEFALPRPSRNAHLPRPGKINPTHDKSVSQHYLGRSYTSGSGLRCAAFAAVTCGSGLGLLSSTCERFSGALNE